MKTFLKWGRKQPLKSKKHGESQTGNPKQNTPKTYINQINEDKTQRTNIKSSKGKATHKGIPIRITADLSIETLQARRQWQNILKVMKEKNL